MILTNVGVKDENGNIGDTSSSWTNDGNLLSLVNLPNAIQNELVKEEEQSDANNNILVVTEGDNLVHNYFHYFECSFDAVDCLSTVIMKLPKLNEENTNYWINYTDYLLIYLGSTVTYDEVPAASNTQEQEANAGVDDLSSITPPTNTESTFNPRYFNTQNKLPFFKGKISRVKEKENSLELYINNIGVRFKQKIPKEFREAYIFNQNVRDAFQAICEFIGVYYICPPKTTTTQDTEDASELGDEESASSEDKDAKSTVSQEKALNDYAKSKTKESGSSSSNSDGSESETEDGENNEEEEEADLSTPQNGYADISFDANGSIVRGSEVIEESPNMADTLLAMDEMPVTGYYEDGDEEADPYILTDLQKFFNGEQFDELHNEVMDYGSITIEPMSSGTSDMSTVGSGTGSSSGSSEGSGEDSDGGSSNSSSSGSKRSYTARAVRNAFKNSTNGMIKSFYNCSSEACVRRLVNSNAKNLKVSKSKAIRLIVDAKKGDGTISTKLQNAIKKAKSSGYSTAKSRR